MVKLSSHGAPDHLWVPEIHRSRQRDRRRRAEGRGSTQYRSDISWILDGIKHKNAAHRRYFECIQRAGRNFADRDDALRRLRFRGAAEILLGNLRYLNARLFELFAQRFTSRGRSKL